MRAELASRARIRGEITLVVEARRAAADAARLRRPFQRGLWRLQNAEGVDEKEALKRVARERGMGKSDAYRNLQRERAKR